MNRLHCRGPFAQPEDRTLSAARSWEGKPSLGFRANTCLVQGEALGGAHGLAAAAGGSFPQLEEGAAPRAWGSLPAVPRGLHPAACVAYPSAHRGLQRARTGGSRPHPCPCGLQEGTDGTQAGGWWHGVRPPAQRCPGVSLPKHTPTPPKAPGLWVERALPAPRAARARRHRPSRSSWKHLRELARAKIPMSAQRGRGGAGSSRPCSQGCPGSRFPEGAGRDGPSPAPPAGPTTVKVTPPVPALMPG